MNWPSNCSMSVCAISLPTFPRCRLMVEKENGREFSEISAWKPQQSAGKPREISHFHFLKKCWQKNCAKMCKMALNNLKASSWRNLALPLVRQAEPDKEGSKACPTALLTMLWQASFLFKEITWKTPCQDRCVFSRYRGNGAGSCWHCMIVRGCKKEQPWPSGFWSGMAQQVRIACVYFMLTWAWNLWSAKTNEITSFRQICSLEK